jgi:hypothetical protein
MVRVIIVIQSHRGFALLGKPLSPSNLHDCVMRCPKFRDGKRTSRRFLIILHSNTEFAKPTTNRNEPLTAAPVSVTLADS